MNKAVIVGGKDDGIEPKRSVVRETTTAERRRLCSLHVMHVVDPCPGCDKVVAVITHGITKVSYVAEHKKETSQGEVKCSYGGATLIDT